MVTTKPWFWKTSNELSTKAKRWASSRVHSVFGRNSIWFDSRDKQRMMFESRRPLTRSLQARTLTFVNLVIFSISSSSFSLHSFSARGGVNQNELRASASASTARQRKKESNACERNAPHRLLKTKKKQKRKKTMMKKQKRSCGDKNDEGNSLIPLSIRRQAQVLRMFESDWMFHQQQNSNQKEEKQNPFSRKKIKRLVPVHFKVDQFLN